MAKINFKQVIKDLDGNPLFGSKQVFILDVEGKLKVNDKGEYLIVEHPTPEESLTLGIVCEKALLEQTNAIIDKASKHDCWTIAKKIHNQEETVLTTKEIEIVKQLVEIYWKVYVAGPAIDLLEGIE